MSLFSQDHILLSLEIGRSQLWGREGGTFSIISQLCPSHCLVLQQMGVEVSLVSTLFPNPTHGGHQEPAGVHTGRRAAWVQHWLCAVPISSTMSSMQQAPGQQGHQGLPKTLAFLKRRELAVLSFLHRETPAILMAISPAWPGPLGLWLCL